MKRVGQPLVHSVEVYAELSTKSKSLQFFVISLGPYFGFLNMHGS